MIEYKLNKNYLNKYTRDLFFSTYNTLVICSLGLIPLTIFFYLVGFLSDKEALTYGNYCLIAMILILAFFICVYFKFKTSLFKNFNDNTIVDYILQFENGVYTRKNVNSNTTYTFLKKDILGIQITKSLIIVRLNNKSEVIIFPKIKEIGDLLLDNKENITYDYPKRVDSINKDNKEKVKKYICEAIFVIIICVIATFIGYRNSTPPYNYFNMFLPSISIIVLYYGCKFIVYKNKKKNQ